MKIRLSPTQESIVRFGEGALMVVAGPGSGKTRVLTERIRRLLNESEGHFRILALTFTNKAANEMKERLEEFPNIEERAFIGTLHSFCMEVLSHRGSHIGIRQMPHIFESYGDRKEILQQAVFATPDLKHILLTLGDRKQQQARLARWLESIRDFKSAFRVPDMIEDPVMKAVYEVYNSGLKASNAVDFDDLLFLTYQLFVGRPKIADFYRRQYKYICVDEAQDINEAQYQLIGALCGQNDRNVMMVGDPKQAIFVWNGANPKYLDMFESNFSAVKISLDENFRSSKAVVEAAQRLDPSYHVQGQLPVEGTLELFIGEDEILEARKVLRFIDHLLSNGHQDIEGDVTLERCAILGRTRYVLDAVESEIRNREWPYYKQLSTQHESESQLVQDFELCLRLVANPMDKFHRGELLSRWRIPDVSTSSEMRDNLASSDVINELTSLMETPDQAAVMNAIQGLKWTESSVDFWAALQRIEDFANSLENQQARALILEDTKVWKIHWDSFVRSEAGGHHSLVTFLSQVSLGATQQPRQDGIALLTVHSSKGLEFDVVCVMGMAEGTFPDYRAKDSALEEEKRNAFVAVTRSKRLLALSYPSTKIMPWGDVWNQKPSRYLKLLGLI